MKNLSKTRNKTFTVNVQNLQFTLFDKTFECTPELDYRVYNATIESLDKLDTDTIIEHITAFVTADDRDAFTDMIADENVLIPQRMLLEIWRYLCGEYGVIAKDDEKK